MPSLSKFSLSPISKSKPPSSIINSSTGPPATVSATNLAPIPPPVRDITSPTSYKEPSFVIVLFPGIPVIVALIKVSVSSVSVPVTCSQL